MDLPATHLLRKVIVPEIPLGGFVEVLFPRFQNQLPARDKTDTLENVGMLADPEHER